MAKLKTLSIFETNSPHMTAALASDFAKALIGGEIILLDGPIGCGKTWFTRQLAKTIGVKHLPISASFGMMRRYKGRYINLYHFDLFRAGLEDMENIGVEEFFGKEDGVTVVEWGAPAQDLALITGGLSLSFELAGGDKRRISARCIGARARDFLRRAEARWKARLA